MTIKHGVFYSIMALLILMVSCKEEDSLTTLEQFEKEQALIDQYLVDNNLTASTDSAGFNLKYIVLDSGSGESPTRTSTIKVNYKGTLLTTGAEFDAADSVIFALETLIPGWQILVPYMKEGGRIKMFIPSVYAYGERGSGRVPGNSTLIFEVTLIDVIDQFEYETERIDDYLKANNLDAEIDTATSMRYVIKHEGEGDSPDEASTVNVDYSGYFLNDNEFDTNTNRDFKLSTLIQGWQYLMPYVKEGGTIIMFIPSKYGYGVNGNAVVPGKTPIIFEVTLNEIK